jgi:curved DNA-binding protein CbpA
VARFDPYAVLGVDHDADTDTIRAHYLALVREWHPDVSVHPDAHQRTVAIIEAFAVLSDAAARARYDRGPRTFMDDMRDWLAERMRAWQVEECLYCGKPLYKGTWTSVYSGTKIHGRNLFRKDKLYCSNAHRQAAYRLRKKNRADAARRLEGRDARTPEHLEP